MVAKLVREGVHGGHGYFGELLCTDEGDNMKVDVLFVPAGSMSAAGDIMADLIDFLDSREEDPDLEPTCGVSYGQPPGADECEPPEDTEPSLGSLDRIMDQARAWKFDAYMIDREQDDCDREDADPDEAKQQAPEMCPCA